MNGRIFHFVNNSFALDIMNVIQSLSAHPAAALPGGSTDVEGALAQGVALLHDGAEAGRREEPAPRAPAERCQSCFNDFTGTLILKTNFNFFQNSKQIYILYDSIFGFSCLSDCKLPKNLNS